MSCKAILRECVAHCEGAVCDAVRDGNGTVGGFGAVGQKGGAKGMILTGKTGRSIPEKRGAPIAQADEGPLQPVDEFPVFATTLF